LMVEQRSLRVGPFAFRCSEAGTGYPLLCLHGEAPAASGVTDFAHNIRVLAQRFRTLLLDLPPRTSDTTTAFHEGELSLELLILHALDEFGVERAHLIGNGKGGELGLSLAVLAPGRVSKLVVAGPTGCLYSPFTPPPLEGSKAIEAYRRNPSREALQEAMRLYVYDNSINDHASLERRHQEATSEGKGASFSTWQAGDLLALAPLVQAPTLIVWGREDRLSPIDFGLSLLARIKDAQFHMLPQCGHWPQREKAEAFNSLVLDFLTGEDALAQMSGAAEC
jgi:4,5:9,10-diseco-3-hydroxy-5,9,17-trioxoandrosta-1(10),2-diene-4-oate hydrolase